MGGKFLSVAMGVVTTPTTPFTSSGTSHPDTIASDLQLAQGNGSIARGNLPLSVYVQAQFRQPLCDACREDGILEAPTRQNHGWTVNSRQYFRSPVNNGVVETSANLADVQGRSGDRRGWRGRGVPNRRRGRLVRRIRRADRSLSHFRPTANSRSIAASPSKLITGARPQEACNCVEKTSHTAGAWRIDLAFEQGDEVSSIP